MCVLRKNKLYLVTLLLACFSKPILASTSLTASGHAGITTQYTSKTPPTGDTYYAIKVPIGLTLSASPSDNLNLYLGLEYAYNNFPSSPILLGQTSTTSITNTYNQSTPMPFANTINAQNGTGGTSFGQKIDFPTLTTAYFTYQTPMGLLKAGRMPRNWGLGIWYNDEWSPVGGTISTSDAVAFTTDLNLFDAAVYYEQYGKSIGGKSSAQDATAFTLEARLKLDPADSPSSGITREIGGTFSIFTHDVSNTSLNIFDTYAKIYLNKFFLGGEILYPNGQSQNPNYQTMGGGPECHTTSAASTVYNQTCNTQDYSALAALVRFKFLLSKEENTTLAATEASQKQMGSVERLPSHVFGFWFGYASGGSNQFYSADNTAFGLGGNKITAITMNQNIQPAFLMFNNSTPSINGMPTGAITNTTFVRADYTYESSEFGSISPILVWGKLNNTNQNYNSQNTVCTTAIAINSTAPINRACLGGTENLGVELDLSYNYTTLDHLHAGADFGYWIVGNAWKVYAQGSPAGNYGARIFASTEF